MVIEIVKIKYLGDHPYSTKALREKEILCMYGVSLLKWGGDFEIWSGIPPPAGLDKTSGPVVHCKTNQLNALCFQKRDVLSYNSLRTIIGVKRFVITVYTAVGLHHRD